jgi:phosphatidylserine/phosphatidylglycerophosphate/cardiolipin synthase-like enzyme
MNGQQSSQYSLPSRYSWQTQHSLVRYGFILLLLVALCVLASCDAGYDTSGGSPSGTTQSGQPGMQNNVAACVSASCAASSVQVFVEPDAGEAPVVDAIQQASSSVWVEVYLMTDSAVIQALEDAAGRGVQVRVLLEAHPYGSGSENPQQLLDELNAAGVQAQASDPVYHYTHEKGMIIDGKTAYIMTCNLTRSGLGGSSSTANREYGVIDSNSDDVNEVKAIFNADWNHQTPQLTVPRLVVSPVNARADTAALIASAHKSLLLEDEEMYDTQSEDALIAAAKRGVSVQVVLPAPSSSGSSNDSDVARLLAGGVQVRYITAPYMHAKLIIVDNTIAFTGSENFSSTSLDENRELGIVISDPNAISTFINVFGQDWAQAQDASGS